jgi:5'-nucleotidase
MNILLTNDDGFHAPGIVALHKELAKVGQVTRVAPATEQSGVGHSITFLTPLIAHHVFEDDELLGWQVEGSPADCVKLGVAELCEQRPDLVVSGVNGGLNAGINILYSGTVAGAIEGAFFGITSVAVSLEFDERADFRRAAELATNVIEQVLAKKSAGPQLYNLNIPTVATKQPRQLRVVPMGTSRYGEHFVKRIDPRGRNYYWATNDPRPSPTHHETDLTALEAGNMTLTTLDYNMTKNDELAEMQTWNLKSPTI